MSKQEAAACLLLALIAHDENDNSRGINRDWIKKRTIFGNLVQELRAEDTETYKEMMRMDYKSF